MPPHAPLAAALAAWGLCCTAGLGAVWGYAAKPGPAVAAAGDPDPAGGRRLEVYLHPRCPCSAATVAELDRVLTAARRAGRPAPPAVCHFFTPAGAGPGWAADAPLWAAAAAVPGVRCAVDEGGARAAAAGAATSGAAVLYDGTGGRAFAGGLTAGRGHHGDSPGNRALVAALCGTPAPEPPAPGGAYPVFGCGLVTPPAGGRTPADARGEGGLR